MNDKKDLITLSLTILRHTFGISFWMIKEQKKLEKKKGEAVKVHDTTAPKLK